MSSYFSKNPYQNWKLQEAIEFYMNSGLNYQAARDSIKKDLNEIKDSNHFIPKVRSAAEQLLKEWKVDIIYFKNA